MKKNNKKQIASISSIIIVLFIAPLIVFAAIYFSNERKNSFAPGSVDIAVNEGNAGSDEGEELEKDYTWVKSGEIYTADKDVKIKDTRKNPGEVLRVCFIPMWYNKGDNGEPDDVCDVFNFGSKPAQSGNAFKYTDGNKTITLKMASDWEQSGWSYSDPNADPPGDGCFYYSGTLDSSKLTAQLLDSVELNSDAYALTDNYVFILDVLADAIQSSGNAYAARDWNTP